MVVSNWEKLNFIVNLTELYSNSKNKQKLYNSLKYCIDKKILKDEKVIKYIEMLFEGEIK